MKAPKKGPRPSGLGEAFGWRLRDFRLEKGLTVQQLADKLGCHDSLVYQWEYGDWMPRLTTLWRLATVLQIEMRSLVPTMREVEGWYGDTRGKT